MEEKATTFKNLISKEYPGHKKKVHSVAWNCSGTKLASGSVDHTARIWSIDPHGHGKVKEVELKGHTDSVDQLCWDPKHSDIVATAAGDKTVRLWDARSGKCSQQAELSGENINITYKPDGTHIAVGNKRKGSIEMVHKIHHAAAAWVIADQDGMCVDLDGAVSKCFPIRFYASNQIFYQPLHGWILWNTSLDHYAVISVNKLPLGTRDSSKKKAPSYSEDELTILDVRKFKPIHRRKFNYEVNEIAWNTTGELFFLTTGNGTVEVLAYPSLQLLHTLMAHTAGCYCIAIDHTGRYFAVGSADSLVSLWDTSEMLCVRTFTKLEWPVRTISFNHTGDFVASASEDQFIDIANVQTGRSVHQIPCKAPMNSVEWNPKYNLLAYAGDDKNKYQADEGVFRIFGFESS